jgi:hypothetical protein
MPSGNVGGYGSFVSVSKIESGKPGDCSMALQPNNFYLYSGAKDNATRDASTKLSDFQG